MSIKFGPSGNSLSFYDQGLKHSYQMPAWLSDMGLSAYEYQCSKGCRIKTETAEKIGEEAKKHSIALSIHAPYYINLSSEGEKRDKSVGYILETLNVARLMGATRIVVHSGGCATMSRDAAMALAKDTLRLAIAEADNAGFSDIHICPETMGKINQLGTIEEVVDFCLLDERLIPTIDFGHLNARTFGGVNGAEDYAAILDEVKNRLGSEREKLFHSHFSKIEYTEKGGEKKHLTFEDTVFGPDFEPLAELVCKRGLTPTFICESDGTMAEDALAMKKMYEEKLKEL